MLDEYELNDNYPVHAGYVYVADGVPFVSEISGDAFQLKRYMKADSLTNCDIYGRREKEC